jgi:hypothetical protein
MSIQGRFFLAAAGAPRVAWLAYNRVRRAAKRFRFAAQGDQRRADNAADGLRRQPGNRRSSRANSTGNGDDRQPGQGAN